MQQLRTQPAGPKAFHLYATVRDAYRQELGERTFAVYAALTSTSILKPCREPFL